VAVCRTEHEDLERVYQAIAGDVDREVAAAAADAGALRADEAGDEQLAHMLRTAAAVARGDAAGALEFAMAACGNSAGDFDCYVISLPSRLGLAHDRDF